MDKETRALLAKLFTDQLKQLAEEKDIDCGEDPDRIDYLSILGKSDLIIKEDVERFTEDTELEEEKGKDQEYLGEIEKIIKDFKHTGSVFDKADELLQGMQSNFDKGDLEAAISQGVTASGLIEDTAENYEKIRKAFVIFAFRQLISDVRESGIDLTDAEKQVSEAADHFHKGENKELDDLLDAIANNATYIQKEHAKRVKDLIFSVEELIDQARDLGANTNEARDFLRKANHAYDSKTFKKVDYFVTKARKAAVDAKTDRIQGISDSLLFVRTILDDARDIGADVIEAERVYTKAKSAFSEESYGECKSLIKEVEQLALELQNAQIQKAMQLRRRREGEREPARGRGKDVVEVEPEAVVSAPQRRPRTMRRATRKQFSRVPSESRPTTRRARKTKCPNCGQGFPVMGGKGPIKIECPYCGMRGMMP